MSEAKRILIAIPTGTGIEADTFRSIYNLIVPEGYVTDFEYFYGYSVTQVRNLIVHFALENKYDYVLFVDSDIVLPRETLVDLLTTKYPIATGVYRQRKEPAVYELYLKDETGAENNITPEQYLSIDMDAFEVDGCGFGGVLVDCKVLDAMEYPHFKYKEAISFEETVSEDIYFCNKAKAAGFKIACVRDLTYGHIGKVTYLAK